jgi:hypothetical protein
MPGSLVGRGNILYDFVIGPTLTPVAVAGSTAVEQSFTILGLQTMDAVDVAFGGTQTAGIGIGNARASTNTLTIEFTNSTAGSLTPASGQYIITICRPENPTIPTNAL